MVTCIVCSREFKTAQALNSHKWRAHTEEGRNHKIPGRPPWNKGKKSKPKLVDLVCKVCGSSFSKEKTKATKCCSSRCAHTRTHTAAAKRKISETLARRNAHKYPERYATRRCKNCENDFVVLARRHTVFCSRHCSATFNGSKEEFKKRMSLNRLKKIQDGCVGYGIKCSYAGVRCDSVLEYAFCKKWLTENPDSNITRWQGIIEKYGIRFIPDFCIDGKPIEVKHTYVNRTNGLSAKWKTYVETQEVKKRIVEELGGMFITQVDIGMKVYRQALKEVPRSTK